MTTQKFKMSPESVVERLLDNGPKPVDSPHWTSYNRAIADWREYLHAELAMLEARRIVDPQPPRLSDEQIREIWVEHGLDDEDVEGFARAIELEILGGGHE